MAALVKAVKLSKICSKNPCILYTAVRNHWNKDFQPGPYPKTAEERALAAKKYGLTPEEYDVYPDDGMGHGDYPKLPLISTEQKDPYYPYDFPELKRNFNEPLHVHAEMIGEDRVDISGRPRFTPLQQYLTFIAVMTGFITVYLVLNKMKMFRPVLAKQYPTSGQKHYSFDPE